MRSPALRSLGAVALATALLAACSGEGASTEVAPTTAAPAAAAASETSPSGGGTAFAADDVDTWAQSAGGGSLAAGTDGRLTIQLHELSGTVGGLTDRSMRSVGDVAEAEFFAQWPDRYAADRPAAVLLYTPEGASAPERLHVTLHEAAYDEEARTVRYTAVAHGGADGASAPPLDEPVRFAQASLLIEDTDVVRATTSIKVVNDVPEADAPTAELRLYQGAREEQPGLRPIARLQVGGGGGTASFPTSRTNVAQATTTVRGFTLTSNQVVFDERSAVLQTQLLVENDYYDFRLVELPGLQPDTVTFDNPTDSPVQFSMTAPPLAWAVVVDEHGTAEMSTAELWSADAVVDGITTATVTITHSDATITITKGDDGSYLLTVS